MSYKKVIRKRIVDANGRVISEATSQVFTQDGNSKETHQSVSAQVITNNSSSSSSSSSSSR